MEPKTRVKSLSKWSKNRKEERMAKPIESVPPFSGKTAEWMQNYLENTTRDPKKEELALRDAEIAKQIRSLPTRD
jgi:hypothetical protein